MAHQSELIARDIGAYLHAQEHKSLLRFITCGSVDDGKSTLIGRLLYESKLIFDDQLTQLAADSRRVGTRGGELDFALLVDGLAAEREQGITIDVAYRFFSTERRKFIVADTPGHEQYTRNMVTGASTADLAVILVDARKGVLVQTRRHSYLVHLLGIPRIVLAVNKMDLVGYSQQSFAQIVAEYREFAGRLGLTDITPIPLSRCTGTMSLRRAATSHGTRGPRSSSISRESKSIQGSPDSRSACRCSGSTARTRSFVASPASSRRERCAGAIACECCPRGARAASPASWSRAGISSPRPPASR
jgi:bifunctional enzyme CysN/CysC